MDKIDLREFVHSVHSVHFVHSVHALNTVLSFQLKAVDDKRSRVRHALRRRPRGAAQQTALAEGAIFLHHMLDAVSTKFFHGPVQKGLMGKFRKGS